MEFLSMEFLGALMSIVLLDLVLAGDNAVVIAMASHRLPDELRKKAIWIGTVGAVAVRTLMTLLAVYILTIPYLQALGGLLLVPIGIKLLKPSGHDEHVQAADTFGGAVRTIIVADAAMGIDNVLAVAGAASGSFLLVMIGLLISIPIVVGSSQLIGRLLDKWPVLIYLGSGILGWTAGSMLCHDQRLGVVLAELLGSQASYIMSALLAAFVCTVGHLKRR